MNYTGGKKDKQGYGRTKQLLSFYSRKCSTQNVSYMKYDEGPDHSFYFTVTICVVIMKVLPRKYQLIQKFFFTFFSIVKR